MTPAKVSILTRPEGRVLLQVQAPLPVVAYWFQSSPGPKAGCYVRPGRRRRYPR